VKVVIRISAKQIRTGKEQSKMNRKVESRSKNAAGETAVMEPETDAGTTPSQEEVAALAYSYWEARGCQGGSSQEDWLRAEKELREQQSQDNA
jgi:hypothetical protein